MSNYELLMERFCVYVVLLGVAFAAPLSQAAQPPRQVLIIHSFGREYAPYRTVTSTFRTELAQQSSQPIEFHEVSLEAARFSDGLMEEAFAEYLRALFAGRKLEMIVPFGAPAVRFSVQYRERISPLVPMVIAAVDRRHLEGIQLGTNTAVVSSSVHLPRTIEHILQLLPQTTNLTAILGTSPLEKYWQGETARTCQKFTNRVSVSFVNHLTLEQMRQQLSLLPPRSAILYLLLTVDAAGVPYEQDAAFKVLAASANAPIFGLFDTQLEQGIVGGPLMSLREIGEGSARVAARILEGEPPASIPTPAFSQTLSAYNWRELQRWNIPQARLPQGSIIHFRPPSVWQQYQGYIIAALAIILAQSLTIGALLLQRTRRRAAENARQQTEEAARQLSGKLITAQEDERKRIARDLHDDLNQRLALLSVEMELLSRDSVYDNTSARQRIDEALRRLKELSLDVHNLAYRLHPAKLDQLGLVAASRALCRELSAQCDVQIDFIHDKIPRDLPRNVALCLYRILQESLQNGIRHSGAQNLRAELKLIENRIRLTVSDSGKGFDVQTATRNSGLGLTSMSERIRQVGGTLTIKSSPNKGTQIEATAPLVLADASAGLPTALNY